MTIKYAKIRDKLIKQILKYFCLELTAVQTAKILSLNRRTIDRYYQIFREKIAKYQENNLQRLSDEIEIDESYFGSSYRGDKRGRSAERKIPVVGVLKRNGKKYMLKLFLMSLGAV